MKITRILFAILSFQFACIGQTFASSITLQSTWQLRGLNTLLFTYDDATPDSNPDPLRGDYVNSLTAVNFFFEGVTYSLDTSKTGEPNANKIHINATPINWGAAVSINAALVGNDGTSTHMLIHVETYPAPLTDSLIEITKPLLFSDSFLDLAGPLPHFSPLNISANTGFLIVQSVPIPAAAWLFLSSLLGLISMARRK